MKNQKSKITDSIDDLDDENKDILESLKNKSTRKEKNDLFKI